MHINDLLATAVKRGASDLHMKVGSFPMLRIDGTLLPANQEKRLDPQDMEGDRGDAAQSGPAAEIRENAGSRRRLRDAEPGPLPLQRVPAARHDRPGHPRHSVAGADGRRAAAAAGAEAHRGRRARPGAGDGDDGFGQVDVTRGDVESHQPHARDAHHDGRGPDRVPPPRSPVDHQSARSPHRHLVVRGGAAQRPASGPRRAARRRNARLGNGGNGAAGGGNGSPRVLDAAHVGRAGEHQPYHRGVPAASAAAGASAARERVEGGDLAAPDAARESCRAERRRSRS